MLHNTKKQKTSGFTIIEIMIVLAIAGLIMLIVFLAVPALQRSSRNTSRKNDAASVLAGFSEYSDNNGGALPTNAIWATPNLTLCNIAGCTGTDAQSVVKLGYYTGGVSAAPAVGMVTIYKTYTAPPAQANAADELIIDTGGTCTSATAMGPSGSTRQYAALFGIEASGGYVWQCTSS